MIQSVVLFQTATDAATCDCPGGLRLPEKDLIFKGKAIRDIHVADRHRTCPCGLTLENQAFFGTRPLCRK